MIYAAAKAGMKLASNAQKAVSSNVGNVLRTDEIPNHKLTGRVTAAVKKSLRESSYQPMVKAYKDVVKDVQTLPEKAVRIWNAWDPERLVNRAKATIRGFWAGFKKNPLKVAWTAGKEAVKSTMMETVPVIRDQETVAYLMGTGVDVRVDSAVRGGPGWGGCAPVRQ
ncbi:hypothetical protein G6F68_014740 [Rhizopus microsporus]|nr:hypothetical protein G6F68_014740 [Rhizopus microsporus]